MHGKHILHYERRIRAHRVNYGKTRESPRTCKVFIFLFIRVISQDRVCTGDLIATNTRAPSTRSRRRNCEQKYLRHPGFQSSHVITRDKRLFLLSAPSANTIVFRRQRFRCTVTGVACCTGTSKSYELAHFILSLANNAQISATTTGKTPFVRIHPSSGGETRRPKLFQPGNNRIIKLYCVDRV